MQLVAVQLRRLVACLRNKFCTSLFVPFKDRLFKKIKHFCDIFESFTNIFTARFCSNYEHLHVSSYIKNTRFA